MAVVLSLLAALAFAVASTAQQRVAARVDVASEAGSSFLRRIGRDPLWLAGTAFDVAAVGLQAAALSVGQLALVQPVLTSGLVIALVLSAALDGRRLTALEWVGSASIAIGIPAFVVATSPHGGASDASALRWIVVGGAVLVIATLAAVGLSDPERPDRRAGALALAAGIVFGVVAALTKTVLADLSSGVAHALAQWHPYALVALALTGLLVSQRAFQAAPLAASLPMLSVADPVVGAVLGVGLFGEHLTIAGWRGAVAALALGAMAAGLAAIAGARRGAQDELTVLEVSARC